MTTRCVCTSVRLSLLCVLLLRLTGADPEGCSGPEVLRVAEETLDQINKDQIRGYILTLNRVYDYTRIADKNSSISLVLDVMETRCHVSSRKQWKQCEVRGIGSVPVYGECEAFVTVDSAVRLHSYTCTTRKVPATEVVQVCPDCPTAEGLEEPVVQEVVSLCLQRFNEESGLNHQFSMDRITDASFQWQVGPSYFVDFTIVETVCLKTSDQGDMSLCSPKDCRSARRGFCEGSHVAEEEEFQVRLPVGQKNMFTKKPVEVKCEIYQPQGATDEKASGIYNHTHLHTHSSSCPGSTPALGTVVYRASQPRSAPTAMSCPGARRHQLGLQRLRL